MRARFAAYREQLLYLLFGVLTMLINYGLFWLLQRQWQGRWVLVNNLITFVAATVFAFLTNKRFVFCSPRWDAATVLREAGAFTAARLFSLVLEEAGLYLAAYRLGLGCFTFGPVDGVLLSKIVLSFLAVVLNYLFSRFWVFRTGKRR